MPSQNIAKYQGAYYEAEHEMLNNAVQEIKD